jgi:DNA mismatch endonuclease (patch repair protein)
MANKIDAETRSRMMASIKSGNTGIECAVRKGLFSIGYRYRIHGKGLPGSPDIVLPKYSATIFVHGCYWHGHDCGIFRMPKTNSMFWARKIARNQERDMLNIMTLQLVGWRVAVVWECALVGARGDTKAVVEQLSNWLQLGDDWLEIRGN